MLTLEDLSEFLSVSAEFNKLAAAGLSQYLTAPVIGSLAGAGIGGLGAGGTSLLSSDATERRKARSRLLAGAAAGGLIGGSAGSLLNTGKTYAAGESVFGTPEATQKAIALDKSKGITPSAVPIAGGVGAGAATRWSLAENTHPAARPTDFKDSLSEAIKGSKEEKGGGGSKPRSNVRNKPRKDQTREYMQSMQRMPDERIQSIMDDLRKGNVMNSTNIKHPDLLNVLNSADKAKGAIPITNVSKSIPGLDWLRKSVNGSKPVTPIRMRGSIAKTVLPLLVGGAATYGMQGAGNLLLGSGE